METGTVDSAKDFAEPHGRWLAEIRAYEKTFDGWKQKAASTVQRFRNEEDTDAQIEFFGGSADYRRMNLLWSNVKLMEPMIYGRPPKPNVSRSYKDRDPVARASAMILERSLMEQMDRGGFDEAMRACRSDYMLTSRATPWLRYEAVYGDEKTEKIFLTENPRKDRRFRRSFRKPEEDEGTESFYEKDVMFDEPPPDRPGAQGAPYIEDSFRPVVYEKVCIDHVSWRDFGHTPAPKWSKVRAVWRRELMTRTQIKDRFGEEISRKIGLTKLIGPSSMEKDLENFGDVFKRAEIYEIWDRTSRSVYWVSPGYDGYLDRIEDPLHLENFFPCPPPVFGTTTPDTLIPIIDYEQYKVQAEEVDRLTRRIMLLTQAIKVVGVYNGSIEELEAVLKSPENQMIAVDNWAMFAEQGGIPGAVSWLPIKEIAEVLQILIQARENAKRDLFEVSGLGDIMRGQGRGGTPVSANEARLTSQFGGMRIEDHQNKFASFVRDVLRWMAEIISEHFGDDVLRMMCNWDETEEARTAQEDYEEWAAQAQQAAQQGQPFPQPPPMHPEQLFAEAVALLREDLSRGYKIDVETDTMVLQDQQEEKNNRVEFITAVTQFLQQAVPAVKQNPEMGPMFSQMLLWAVRGFRAGRQLEAAIERMAEDMIAGKSQPDPEQIAQQLEMQIKQQDLAQRKEIEDQKIAVDANRVAGDLELRREELDLERERLALDREKLRIEELKAQPQDTSAQEEFERAMRVRELEQDIREREDKLQLDRRELDLKIAQHNRDLIVESEEEPEEGARKIQPTAVPSMTTAVTSSFERAIEQMSRMMMQMQQQAIERQDQLITSLAERQDTQMRQIAALLSAPKTVVRDPETGRVIGMETTGSVQ